MMTQINYFSLNMPSKGHSAIYKIHKYFARRPHNQFRSVIEHYVPKNGIVLDCFAGGGVTLVEGLTAGRRVISADINPIASMVQHGQTIEVDADRINEITSDIAMEVGAAIGNHFKTTCRSCSSQTDYRWIERAYFVACPFCNAQTLLNEKSKAAGLNGRPVNGSYDCSTCHSRFPSVSAKRLGSAILNVRYRCTHCSFEETALPTRFDEDLDDVTRNDEIQILEKFDLVVPSDSIPLDWDRQVEDALSRKGFAKFADLFTPRNRLFLAFALKKLQSVAGELTQDEYVGALTQISALIRYVNSMTFSTSSWMDGRPVAWAKHAYWTPNQFIEVNPFEYLAHRQLAVVKWEADRKTRFSGKVRSRNPMDVIQGNADFSIICGDSRLLAIPNDSIDAVITDPPFGGNVQYGELTHLWQVWLRESNPYERELFDLKPEILVHRKKRSFSKTPEDYESGLREVFQECFRVLKSSGVLTFTFNNKSASAWYAVMRAAIDAGFILEDGGVHYQEEIKAYRDTAHLRYNGELQGDVLYSFLKPSSQVSHVVAAPDGDSIGLLRTFIDASQVESEDKSSSPGIALHLWVVRRAAQSIQAGESIERTFEWLNLLTLVGKSNRTGMSILDTCKELIGGHK
jgi:putative DNA methylase